MSQWEYLVKEFILRDTSLAGERKYYDGDEFTAHERSACGNQLQAHLDELGKDGWEVFNVEYSDNNRRQTGQWVLNDAQYRIWAKRRAE